MGPSAFPVVTGDPTVAVIGLGYVGSCVAAVLGSQGLDTIGVDTDVTLIDELNRGHCRFQEEELAGLLAKGMEVGALKVTTELSAVSAADVVLIAVGTPVRADGSLAEEQLRSACEGIAGVIRPGQLLVLKSTVPPGTTRDLVLPILERSGLRAGEDFGLAFTPERLAEGTALKELRTFPIAIGGLDAPSLAGATDFWQRALGVPTIPMESLEAAEIVKLADNWWIDLNIALANELAKFCALYDVDVLDVIAAANTIPKGRGNVNILLPSVGVGGSCLTKDPLMVWQSALRRGLDIRTAPVGREVNAAMPGYTAQVILDGLAAAGKDPADATVAVLGLAFKNNTGDLRATPVQGAVEALRAAGVRVRTHDPLVDADHAERLTGVRPTGSVQEACEGADAIAVLALHREFEDVDFGALPVADSCLVVDGRAYYPKAKIAELRAQGFVYRGIGR
ncbi:nucleotide sugar dehydrogenase [Actinomadura rayongensis]|uniref:Nucleotide sugar dehydrogenase n=1 Tax=Actinomadura rayongensis TaxID=1429076 RepID=A0A6I4W7A9_9ACTN|nr:nucleotide sugar dehydrogenase [Actinomadura rayongensis]MXQ63034.1 nucleotide sugar dehydrogenase [Actinomadura rayongensis]